MATWACVNPIFEWHVSPLPDYRPQDTAKEWHGVPNRGDFEDNPLKRLVEGVVTKGSDPVVWVSGQGLMGHDDQDPDGLWISVVHQNHTFIWIQFGLEWDEEWAQRRLCKRPDPVRIYGVHVRRLDTGPRPHDYAALPVPLAPVSGTTTNIIVTPIRMRRFVDTTVVLPHGCYSYLEHSPQRFYIAFELYQNPFHFFCDTSSRGCMDMDALCSPVFRCIRRQLGLVAWGDIQPQSFSVAQRDVDTDTSNIVISTLFSSDARLLWSLSSRDFALIGWCRPSSSSKEWHCILPMGDIYKQAQLVGQPSASFHCCVSTLHSSTHPEHVTLFGAWAWTDSAYVSFRDTWCGHVAPHLTPRELVAIVWDYAGVLAPPPVNEPLPSSKRKHFL